MSRIRGTPGGKQFKTGSCGFALACGPYPGLAARYRSAAHACNGGSFGLNVIVSRRSIHTPSNSCAWSVAAVPALPAPSTGRAKATAAKNSAAAPIRIETIRTQPTLQLPRAPAQDSGPASPCSRTISETRPDCNPSYFLQGPTPLTRKISPLLAGAIAALTGNRQRFASRT